MRRLLSLLQLLLIRHSESNHPILQYHAHARRRNDLADLDTFEDVQDWQAGKQGQGVVDRVGDVAGGFGLEDLGDLWEEGVGIEIFGRGLSRGRGGAQGRGDVASQVSHDEGLGL